MKRARAPAKPRQNWARISKVWLPISSLPTGGTPVVLANDDQTITWFSEKPSKAAVGHTEHARNDDGALVFDEETGEPITEASDVTPTWWSPAVYVNKYGEPV